MPTENNAFKCEAKDLRVLHTFSSISTDRCWYLIVNKKMNFKYMWPHEDSLKYT